RRDPDFLVLARTDARAVEGFDSAVARGRAYLEAGADGIFPEALESAEEFRDYAQRLRGALLLANMTEFGKSPLLVPLALAARGHRRAFFPPPAFRAGWAVHAACRRNQRKAASRRACFPRMQPRRQLYRLLDYDPAAPSWPTPQSAMNRRPGS